MSRPNLDIFSQIRESIASHDAAFWSKLHNFGWLILCGPIGCKTMSFVSQKYYPGATRADISNLEAVWKLRRRDVGHQLIPPGPMASRSMSRIGDAKYASEKISTANKITPTIDAALPSCSCSIDNLPDAAFGAIFLAPSRSFDRAILTEIVACYYLLQRLGRIEVAELEL
jgi:hypothetical protein